MTIGDGISAAGFRKAKHFRKPTAGLPKPKKLAPENLPECPA